VSDFLCGYGARASRFPDLQYHRSYLVRKTIERGRELPDFIVGIVVKSLRQIAFPFRDITGPNHDLI
jgi:hypothetical protein